MNKRAELFEVDIRNLFCINNKNTVYWLLNFWLFSTDRFVNAAANTVATDSRLEDFFTNYNAVALAISSVRCKNQGYFRIPDCFAVLIGISYPAT